MLGAIAHAHGLTPPRRPPRPWTGATSRVYPCGEAVVKIPFDTPAAIDAVRIDAAITAVARALGVPTPEVLAFDATRELLSVPYAVVRRVRRAVPLDRIANPTVRQRAWEAVGRELARVHAVRDEAVVPIPLRSFRQTAEVDPRPWVEELRARGALDEADARWLRDLLDALAPAALAEAPPTLCHGDLNAANILVDAHSGRLCALIDWAGAGWLDPVWDVAGVRCRPCSPGIGRSPRCRWTEPPKRAPAGARSRRACSPRAGCRTARSFAPRSPGISIRSGDS